MGGDEGSPGSEVLQHAEQQFGYICAAFAQGWQRYPKGSEGVGELRRKASSHYQWSETALGEGNDTRSLGSTLAQKAKKSGLGGLRKAFRGGKIEHSS